MDSHVIAHFKKHDPILYEAMKKITPLPPLRKSSTHFQDLCETIINQQLSDKAASTIFSRFKALFPKGNIVPGQVVVLEEEKMRKTGPSKSKVLFMKELARKIIEKELDLEYLDTKDNETVIYELTKVKGIGKWTAEMFLMFSLAREDVFSLGDLGLKKAIQKLYKLKDTPTVKQMEKLSSKWIPYRTHAARILWRCLFCYFFFATICAYMVGLNSPSTEFFSKEPFLSRLVTIKP